MATATTTPARRKKASPPEVDLTPTGLAHLVPAKVFADDYIVRDISGTHDVNLLRYARKSLATTGKAKNVLLFGPTGPGKTSLVFAAGAKDSVPVVTIPANGGVDPSTIFGSWVPTEDGKFVYVESDVTKVIRFGGILYIDEVNFLPPKIASVLHSLLDKRRTITLLDKQGEVITAHPELLIVAAYNPDYEGTKPLNQAFRNRFQIKVKFDYDPDIEARLIFMPVLLEIATQLRARFDAGDLVTPVSTNLLMEFEDISGDLGLAFAMENFLAAFHDDERQSVRDVLELNSDKLAEQYEAFMADED